MNTPDVFSTARWIGDNRGGDGVMSIPAPYFRKEFSLPAAPVSARLFVTALGLHECEINGLTVSADKFAPGWTDYHKRLFYQTYDVTKLLRAGANVLGAVLGDGWYCGKLGWQGRQNYGKNPALLASLTVTCADGSSLTVTTDESWATATGPVLANDFQQGETYDARLELDGWSSAGFDARDWRAAATLTVSDDAVLEPAPHEPVREHERWLPLTVTTLASGSRLFDLGQNFSGYAELSVRAARGRMVTLRFAEILNPDGTPYYANLRGAKATDVYICKGGELETWKPRFTFHGFRYVEISGLRAEDEANVAGIAVYSDLKPSGTFACSNWLVNRLQHNIVWGQKSNFIDVPTDCPQRDERLGWTADAQVFARTACFNMDSRRFFRKWLLNLRDAQHPSGGVPAVAPNGRAQLTGHEDAQAGWSDAMVLAPWTLYLWYGEKAVLEEHYDAMARFMDYQRRLVKDGIRAHPALKLNWEGHGDWLAQDVAGGSGWQKCQGGTPKDLVSTAYYARVAEVMSKIARALGKTGDALRYARLRTRTVTAFRRRFLTADGLLSSGTQTAYVLALHFDLLPKRARATATMELVRNIEWHDWHLTTGFLGTPHLLDVLAANGRLDVAYKLLEQETFPSWLFPVKHGATTIWERWDGWHPERGFQDVGMNSFNHYAYGAVGAWLVSAVAGLDWDEERSAYQHIIFRPRPGGRMAWAEASLTVSGGEARIRWELRHGDFYASLTVPAGSEATFVPPPGFEPSRAVKLAAGRHEFNLKGKKI